MTFNQIFTGRLILMKTQRHLAQKYFCYAKQDFISPEGKHAYLIVEGSLQELEREFDAKKRSRSQTMLIRRQRP